MIRWTKPALRARLQALSQRHRGRELVEAVVAFADTLEEDDRKALQEVLLEREPDDGALEYVVRKRPKERRFRLFRRRR